MAQQQSGILGPDGKPIPETLCVRYGGRVFPYRLINQDILREKDPRIGLMGVLVQMGDTNNLMWLMMLTLAKDLYSRMPEGSREFEKLAKEMGLVIVDGNRGEIDIAQELNQT